MTLRKLTEADALPMLELLTDKTVKQTYMLPDFENPSDTLPLFHRLVQFSQDDCHFVRGICVDGNLVGFLNDVEIEKGSVELGYVVHPKYWGKGYATAALKLAIRELFALGHREVTAGAFVENTASLRVMEKAGMTRLSKTDTIEYRGKAHHCIYYAVREEE